MSSSDDDDDTLYEVDKLIAVKRKKGSRYYRVRWAGYDASADTWEREQALRTTCPDSIEEFWQARKKRPGKYNKSTKIAKDVRPHAVCNGDAGPRASQSKRGRLRSRPTAYEVVVLSDDARSLSPELIAVEESCGRVEVHESIYDTVKRRRGKAMERRNRSMRRRLITDYNSEDERNVDHLPVVEVENLCEATSNNTEVEVVDEVCSQIQPSSTSQSKDSAGEEMLPSHAEYQADFQSISVNMELNGEENYSHPQVRGQGGCDSSHCDQHGISNTFVKTEELQAIQTVASVLQSGSAYRCESMSLGGFHQLSDYALRMFAEEVHFSVPSHQFDIRSTVLPMHCWPMVDNDVFRMTFVFEEEPRVPMNKELLYIMPTMLTQFAAGTHRWASNSPPAVRVTLNNVEQIPLVIAGKLSFTFWPLHRGVNHLKFQCDKAILGTGCALLFKAYLTIPK